MRRRTSQRNNGKQQQAEAVDTERSTLSPTTRSTKSSEDNIQTKAGVVVVVPSSHEDDDDLQLPVSETWDEIVMSCKVVNGFEPATSRVTPPSPPSFLGVMRLLKRFWVWNVTLVCSIFGMFGVMYMGVLYYRYCYEKRDGNNSEDIDLSSFMLEGILQHGSIIPSHDVSIVRTIRFILWSIGKFLLMTVILFVIRACQRLSWYTTEFGTYENVKDEATYQDDTLLEKAWMQGLQTCGWQDPSAAVTSKKEEDGTNKKKEILSSPQIIFQPRPGFCGIASFNSILRTFRGKRGKDSCSNSDSSSETMMIDADNNDPYIQLHSLPRYVTLEEAHQLFTHLIKTSTWSSSAECEVSTATPITSVETAGGGKKGFVSYDAFVETLKQMNHPTQPARILAIYGRSPLFFCHQTGWKGMMQKILTFSAGHWSPIVSYLEEEDLVLVMDVNRTYGSRGYLVPSRRMYDAVNTKCVVTGLFRGLLLLRGPPVCSSSGISSTPQPLFINPTEISCAMGKLKEAYYQHIATGTDTNKALDSCITVSDMTKSISSDNSKCIRLVALGEQNHRNDDSSAAANLHAVVSMHPMTFTNTCILPRNNDNDGPVNCTKQSFQTMMKLFEKLVVPMTVTVRGCPDHESFQQIHKTLLSSGLAPAMIGPKCFYINLLPKDKGSYRNLLSPMPNSEGFQIHELKTASASQRDADLMRQWAQVATDSYGFPQGLIRHGKSPGQFLGDAYNQGVIHGKNLRQFVYIHKQTDRVIACSTMYRNQEVIPNVACIFNVCVLKEYRGLGLGKYMTQIVMAEAANSGCIQMVLEASPKGQPV